MDGLLLVDKPSGPTSHDVVARARRILREKRIGHTGTLDPLASGVLPLLVGRATRLARFLPGDKAYDAVVRLGQNTDTYDSQGTPSGPQYEGPWPARAAVDTALGAFRGTFLQQPPVYSAKKIGGQRSYAIARRSKSGATAGTEPSDATETLSSRRLPQEDPAPVLPTPTSVTAHAVDLLGVDGPLVRLHVRCSAGFYIRSLAYDLGAALGTGAHLVDLRRTEAAGHGLAETITLDRLMADDGRVAGEAALVPMGRMLGSLPAVELTAGGVAQVRFGRNLRPEDASRGFGDALLAATSASPVAVRLLGPAGDLVAMADAADTPGLLHPAVVLL